MLEYLDLEQYQCVMPGTLELYGFAAEAVAAIRRFDSSEQKGFLYVLQHRLYLFEGGQHIPLATPNNEPARAIYRAGVYILFISVTGKIWSTVWYNFRRRVFGTAWSGYEGVLSLEHTRIYFSDGSRWDRFAYVVEDPNEQCSYTLDEGTIQQNSCPLRRRWLPPHRVQDFLFFRNRFFLLQGRQLSHERRSLRDPWRIIRAK
jgi:hypothetical protein